MNHPGTLHKENEVFFYQGQLTFDIITVILSDFEKALLQYNVEKARFKRIFSTTVEILENIQAHGMVYRDRNYPYFRVSFKSGIFILESANLIEFWEVQALKEKIEALNKEFPSLKEVLKKMILHNELSAKGGAGLGLYIIRRNILGDICYKIEPINNEISVFELKVFL